MDSVATFICGGIFILALFGIGLYLILRRPKPEEGAGFAQPLPYTPQPAAPGQQADAQQPQVIYVQRPPKKRGLLSRPIDWIALALLIVIAAAIMIPSLGGSPIGSSHKITYQVRGSVTSANVTLMNGSGGIEQRVLSVPIHVTYDMDYMASVSILAQKQTDAGSITCEVYDGDALWLSSTSTAPYGIVTCAGLVGNK